MVEIILLYIFIFISNSIILIDAASMQITRNTSDLIGKIFFTWINKKLKMNLEKRSNRSHKILILWLNPNRTRNFII